MEYGNNSSLQTPESKKKQREANTSKTNTAQKNPENSEAEITSSFKELLNSHMQETLTSHEQVFWGQMQEILEEEEIDDEETKKYIQGLYQQGYNPTDIKAILQRAKKQHKNQKSTPLNQKALRHDIATDISQELRDKIHQERQTTPTEQNWHMLQFASDMREKSKKKREAEKRRTMRNTILEHILEKQLEIYEIHIDAEGNLCIKMKDGTIRCIPLPTDIQDTQTQKLIQQVKQASPEMKQKIINKLSSLTKSTQEKINQASQITKDTGDVSIQQLLQTRRDLSDTVNNQQNRTQNTQRRSAQTL